MITCFEYFKSLDDGQWYFHLKAPNGGILVQSGSYETKDECLYGIHLVRLFSDVAALSEVHSMKITAE